MTNLIIIDASGSMNNKRDDVKGGLKQIFADIKKLDTDTGLFKKEKVEKTTTIVVDFSDDFRVLVKSEKSEDLNDSIADNYSTRGGTALFDAIGRGFAMIPEDENKVFVNILTDGEENTSHEWKADAIKKLIAAKKEKGWAILFIGADEKCIDTAVSLGITRGNTMSFSAGASTGNRSLKSKIGRKGYDGTLNYARAMYSSMASPSDGQSLTQEETFMLSNLMEEGEKLRVSNDKEKGIKENEI